jgi:hypothetical protein
MKIIVLKTSCLLLLSSMHIVSLAMDLTAIKSERDKYLKLAEEQQAYEKERASAKPTSPIDSQAARAILQGDAIEQDKWEETLEKILSKRAQARL